MQRYFPQRKSVRLSEYDYSSSGWYFITICTQDHHELFGKIVDSKMILNEYGKIVGKVLLKLPQRYKNIKLDKYIIMPNHFHGIIVINNDNMNNNDIYCRGRVSRPVNPNRIETPNGRGNPAPTMVTLGQIIAYFKYQSTKQINILFGSLPGTKLWQRNYYEHIIRNEKSLNKIRQYIIDNPPKWEIDKYNPKNIEKF